MSRREGNGRGVRHGAGARARSAALALAAAALGACTGLIGDHGTGDGGAGDALPGTTSDGGSPGLHGCVSTAQYFDIAVYGAVLSQKCAGCHNPDGVARGTRMVLRPPLSADALQADLLAVQQMATTTDDSGQPLLLRKPTLQTPHFGGNVLSYTAGQPNADYAVLQEFVRQAQHPTTCPDDARDVLAGVPLLDWRATLRKASMSLRSRLPTDAELAQVDAQGEAGFDAVLATILDDRAFGDRVMEYFNDQLFTDKFIYPFHSNNQYPALYYTLNGSEFDDAAVYWFEHLTDAQRAATYGTMSSDDLAFQTNRAVAREPVALVAYVVRNDLPFTDVVTADYLVVNPYSARAYAAQDVTFPSATDADDWRATHQFGAASRRVDRAGLLSSPIFLNRYPTTDTNIERARARMTYKVFLATDVLRLGRQPPSTSPDTSPMTTPACVACHGNLDPLAGTFQNFDFEGSYLPAGSTTIYGSTVQWPTDIFAPGFAGEPLPAASTPRALAWVGQRIAADRRFAYAAVHHAYGLLFGRPPLELPTDPTDPGAQDQRAAFLAQRHVIDQVVDAFVADHYNFKTALRLLIKSTYYRAASVPAGRENDATLADLGTVHLLTPEQLSRKIIAVTGLDWRLNDNFVFPNYLLDDYSFFYGGIDNDVVVSRPSEPSGLMANVVSRMANDVACTMASYDFTRAASDRSLLRLVEPNVAPESAAGAPQPDAVALIRQQIQALHAQVLNEDLPLDAPEIDLTYQLFYDVWHAGRAAIAAGTATSDLGLCGATFDVLARDRTFPDLPASRQLTTDPNYTVRAWAIVLAGLLSDERFIYE